MEKVNDKLDSCDSKVKAVVSVSFSPADINISKVLVGNNSIYSNSSNSSLVESSDQLSVVNTDPRFFVPIHIKGKTYKALVDTGLTRTYVGKRMENVFRNSLVP